MQCLNLHERTAVVNADGLAAPKTEPSKANSAWGVWAPVETPQPAFKGEAGVKRLLASFAPLQKVE